jgi:hypothetical protein
LSDAKIATHLAKASVFLVAKDNKYANFQNITRTPGNPTGDYLYLIADYDIFVFFIHENGKLEAGFSPSVAGGFDKELKVVVTRLMVLDQNIMTLCNKEITVFQFQNSVIQQKQKFPAFKDVEDIAISRVDGMRIFKVKGTKGKFKVFSTLPSSDWNPYIEGVSKKALLDDKEYPKVELLNAQYGNIAIMAYTGKYYKYFVVVYYDQGKWI